MNVAFQPERPPEPLQIKTAEQEFDGELHMVFNRPLTEDEVEAYRQLPPTPQMFADVRSYAERLVLTELVCRLFRFYILGGVVTPDTPLVMDWLKSYMDGTGHGPLGHPLRWPRMCPSAISILQRWGYEPTPGDPPFVAKSASGPQRAAIKGG